MSDYTKVNVKEIEDAAVRFGLSPGLEARFGNEALGLTTLGVGYERLAPGFRVPFGHRHAEQEELYVVLSGGGRLAVGDDVVDVGPLDAIRVGTGVMRAFEAGPDGLELLAVGAPPVGRDDAELVNGWWAGA